MAPSLAATAVVWTVMLASGWIIARGVMEEGGGVDYPTFVLRRLGRAGMVLTVPAYLVLLYGIIAAHLGAGGSVLSAISGNGLSPAAGVALFFAVATAISLAGVRMVERINTVLLIGLFMVFMLIVFASLRAVDPARFLYTDWKFLVSTVPVIVCAQAYQLIVPVVCRTLENDPKLVMRALIVGTLIPVALNVLWILAVVGTLPLTGQHSLMEAFAAGQPATVPLAAVLQSPLLGRLSLAFSITVLFTSYVLQSTAVIGYLEDLLPLKPGRSCRLWATGLGFLPPLVVVFVYPALFLKAPDIIGGGSVIILFGIVPALIMYRERRAQRLSVVLPLVLLAACAVFFCIEIAQETGMLRISPNVEYWPVGK